MTVDQLRRTMPMDEYIAWGVYYGRRAQQRELANARGR